MNSNAGEAWRGKLNRRVAAGGCAPAREKAGSSVLPEVWVVVFASSSAAFSRPAAVTLVRGRVEGRDEGRDEGCMDALIDGCDDVSSDAGTALSSCMHNTRHTIH